jgi:outer membrane protein insertion porin family
VDRRRKPARLSGFLVALALFLVGAAQPLHAQAFDERIRIQQIVVEGNQRIDAATVVSYLAISPGDTVSAAIVDEALKALFASGLFADVTITQEGPILHVVVVENPIINRVVYEGNRKKKTEDLQKEEQLGPRVVFTRAKVQADVQRILEIYRRSGRFAATVVPKIIELPQNRVDLIFEINEGPVTGVRRISIIGNRHYSDKELRDEIATRESRWYRFLSGATSYDPDRLTYDRELLRRFYLSRGYADFRIISGVAELTPDGRDFFITFTLEEGERYRFGDIDVETSVKALSAEDLRRSVRIKKGSIYNIKEIDDVIEDLTFAAGTRGYAFVDIRPQVRRNRDTRIIDITFQVDEGPRVYVEEIKITGNTRTLDKVVRREIRLAEGDAFNRILVDRSKTRIKGLDFFKKVEITEEAGSAPDRTILHVEVEEQPTGELSLGAGFSSVDRFIIDFSMTERNLLGRGQFLRFRVSWSDRRKQIDLRFLEPYFMDRNLAAGFDIYKIETDFRDEAGFDTDSLGLTLRSSFPLTEYSRLAPHYTIRNDDVEVDALSCLFGFIARSVCESAGKTTSSILGYVYSLDHRDDPTEPTKGYLLSFTQDWAGLGGSEYYVRSELGFDYYLPVEWFGWEKVIANFSATAGYIVGYGGHDVRLNDRFFKGASTFRGFETAGVGPRDTLTNDALGGEIYGIGTTALSFPLGLPEEFGILGSLFADFGTVGKVHDDNPGVRDDLSLRVSIGVGVLWDSPFGPVRIDFAVPLMKEDYDQSQSFRFSAGTRF